MRPPNKADGDGELIVQKNSGHSFSVAGQTFTFGSVAEFYVNTSKTIYWFSLPEARYSVSRHFHPLKNVVMHTCSHTIELSTQ